MMPSSLFWRWRAPTPLPRSGAGFDAWFASETPGRIDLMIEGGNEDLQPFLGESGGHRWQRVPPTERRGRVHSSTVTVVAMPVMDPTQFRIPDREIEVSCMRGSGAGGQHRNVTESAVRMRHRPSGIEVRICVERSQIRNRQVARELLETRVAELRRSVVAADRSRERRVLAGTGERGDKIRTYRTRDDLVLDHRTGNRSSVTAFLKGRLPR